MATKSELKIKDAEAALNGLLDSITETLQSGDDVSLIGFGTFKVSERAERKGRNPKTGEEITIPACKAVKFTAGKALKEGANYISVPNNYI